MTHTELRALLELAAKACDFDTSHQWNPMRMTLADASPALVIRRREGDTLKLVSTAWNPAWSDGDGAKMEAALMLDVTWHPHFVRVGACAMISMQPYAAPGTARYQDHGGDRQAARRMAALQAAAAIGRGMP